jgi:hypothetical protein
MRGVDFIAIRTFEEPVDVAKRVTHSTGFIEEILDVAWGGLDTTTVQGALHSHFD